MGTRFDYFVVFAEMRTGSNFLEENINEYPGLTCYGEAFNPAFVGGAKSTSLLGVSLQERDTDPFSLLDQMRVQTEGLPGFRFFNNHDPRVFDHILKDPRCAKIILTRNAVDSYVSHKIALSTGQWRLGDLKNAKKAPAEFVKSEFEALVDRIQDFQIKLMHGLQTTGQTGFYVSYEDAQDVDVLDGLAMYLGVDHKKRTVTKRTKVQNPESLDQKVSNFDEMQNALAGYDRWDLTRTPNFEPRRPPSVPTYIAAQSAPLLYQPIKSGPETQVTAWLAALDKAEPENLIRGFNQKSLRDWKKTHPRHRAFTVLRHPVKRLHQAFVTHILLPGPECFTEIRENLRANYGMQIPEGVPGTDYNAEAHRKAFLIFAEFSGGTLNGQTSTRVDPAWASQTEVLQGMCAVQIPDMILREDDFAQGATQLCQQVGIDSVDVPDVSEDGPVSLANIYDKDLESAVRPIYRKDYINFGFKRLKL